MAFLSLSLSLSLYLLAHLLRLLGKSVGNWRSWRCKFLGRFLLVVVLTFGEGKCGQGQTDQESIMEPEMSGDIFLVREGSDLLFGGVLGEPL